MTQSNVCKECLKRVAMWIQLEKLDAEVSIYVSQLPSSGRERATTSEERTLKAWLQVRFAPKRFCFSWAGTGLARVKHSGKEPVILSNEACFLLSCMQSVFLKYFLGMLLGLHSCLEK